jgi:hypothetical protein
MVKFLGRRWGALLPPRFAHRQCPVKPLKQTPAQINARERDRSAFDGPLDRAPAKALSVYKAGRRKLGHPVAVYVSQESDAGFFLH